MRYTRRAWGDAQAREYADTLKRGIEGVVSGQLRSKAMSDLHPGLRVAHCRHHYIFYLPRHNAPTWVVAILHERMDLIARIESRLT